MEKDEIKLDEFHYHEVVDRTHITIEFLYNILTSHWVFQAPENADLKAKLDKIGEELGEIYQEVSNRADKLNDLPICQTP